MKGLSKGLGLKLRLLSQVSAPKTTQTFVLGLVVFTKNLRPVLGLAKAQLKDWLVVGLNFVKRT